MSHMQKNEDQAMSSSSSKPCHGTVRGLATYPVKGLSGLTHTTITLAAQKCLPMDRVYAVECKRSDFDETAPGHVRKSLLVQMARFPEIGRLLTTHNGSHNITIEDPEGGRITLDLAAEESAAELIAFLRPRIKAGLGADVRVLRAGATHFTDQKHPYLSIINQTTLNALAPHLGITPDLARLRGNILIETDSPWDEMQWVDRTFRLGECLVRGIAPITRCPNTSLHPVTGARDCDFPKTLKQQANHMDCGLFVEVIEGGTLEIDATIAPV